MTERDAAVSTVRMTVTIHFQCDLCGESWDYVGHDDEGQVLAHFYRNHTMEEYSTWFQRGHNPWPGGSRS